MTSLTNTLTRWQARARSWLRRGQATWDALQSKATAESEPALIDGLLNAAVPSRRWQAASALAKHPLRGDSATAALVRALADPEVFVRWQAAEALARQEAGHVFPVLVAALEDPEPLRRAGAAEALGRLGGEAACDALRKRLADASPVVRAALAQALGGTCDPAAADSLVPLLLDPEPDVRRAAAGGLGRLAIPRAAVALADALAADGQPLLVRRALAAALAHAAHPDAQPKLLAALEDPDPQVRGYAAQALGQVGSELAHPALAALRADQSKLLKGSVGDRATQALSMLEQRGRREAAKAAPAPAGEIE